MSKPIRVLLLEDSISDAEINIRELQRGGFVPQWKRVETEADFLSELETLPDLILADYALPHFDGLRAVKLLRERGLDIPFILISGTVGEDVAVEAMKYGATDYMLKDRIVRLGPAVERALDEKQLRVERRTADAQRERLAAIVEASPDFIGYADPKTTLIQFINKHGRRMCGIGDNEELGNIKISDVHPAWMNKLMTEVILPNAVRDGFWEGEGAFLHRNGREVPISMALMARKTANGEVDIFYTVSRDITERKRGEASLQQQAEELRVRNDTLSRFNRVAVDRELRMIELKREVNELCGKLGEPSRHKIAKIESVLAKPMEAQT